MTESEQRKVLQENAWLHAQNRILHQKVDALIRQLFGKKSEAMAQGQLELLLSGLEHEEPGELETSAFGPKAEVITKEKKAHPRRARIPEHLPVVEEVLDPEPVKACPEAWRYIGNEVSEQLDYEPGRFLRRRMIRRKYVKRSDPDDPPLVAVLPERLIERGLLAPGLLAHVVVSKYADHLPLYRQEQIYRQRYGVELPRQTLSRAIEQVADWLRPVVREMTRGQFKNGYVQIDETPIRYLAPGKGKCAQGYLWAAHVPGGDTVYHWYASRAHTCLKSFVPQDFQGTIQCDGYRAYQTYADTREGVELLACWAHVRRKFFEAFEAKESPMRSGWVLRQIGHLYSIERQLRRSRAGPALREAIRQSQSRMIFGRIKRTLDCFNTSKAHLPQSLMGKATAYALSLWSRLSAWLEDGRLEIDNNLVENAIRPTAVGKKNWLFVGAEEAGWKGAVIYSIITSCRSRGVDPYAYLKDVLERLPSMTNRQIPDITPAAWAFACSDRMTRAS